MRNSAPWNGGWISRSAGSRRSGCWTSIRPNGEPHVTEIIRQSIALTLARTQASLELGLRYRSAIVDSLVSGHFLDSQDARRKARIIGIADTQPFRVAVARRSVPATSQPDGSDEQDLAGELLARLAGSIQDAAAIRGPQLVMLLPEQDGAGPQARNIGVGTNPPAARTELLLRQAGAGRLTCGLSEVTRWPEMAPQALRQAQHAIDLGIRLGRGGQVAEGLQGDGAVLAEGRDLGSADIRFSWLVVAPG